MAENHPSSPKNFEEELKDRSRGFVCDYSEPSRKLLVAFGGIRLGLGIVPFEFFQLAKGVPAKKLFLRDPAQAWYHRPLPDVGNNIGEVAQFLRREIEREGIEHTVFVGNSMGGYAALLFGALIGADQVCAFAPQTFIGPLDLFRARDFRWKRHVWKAYLRLKNSRFFDVRSHVETAGKTRAAVFYSTKNRLDAVHAEHLAGLSNVTLRAYPEGGHRLIKALRDRGELAEIIRKSLETADDSKK